MEVEYAEPVSDEVQASEEEGLADSDEASDVQHPSQVEVLQL